MVDTPQSTCTAPAGHYLVVDEEHIVPGADLTDDLEIAVRGRGAGQSRTHYWLGDEGCDVIRVLLADGGFERAGAQQVAVREGLFEGTAVAEGGRNVRRVDVHGLEQASPVGDARETGHRNGVAVERLPAGDDLVFGGLAALDPVLARQAYGIVGGIGAGAGDPHPAMVFQLAGRQADDQVGQVEEGLVGKGMGRVEREIFRPVRSWLGTLPGCHVRWWLPSKNPLTHQCSDSLRYHTGKPPLCAQ